MQAIARLHLAGQAIEKIMAGAMVPLMRGTLAIVIGSQVAAVGSRIIYLARIVPLYVAFVIIAVLIGRMAGRAAHLDVPSTRAAMFSATTRNSLASRSCAGHVQCRSRSHTIWPA
ncbi:sodium Bile acid symporter family protein [Pseudarthrobacter siccitolerans]|uniref:Sodium Bile acid symporter family protein n=1 Tax=Pseudarthrobacter siccitolerans TaxID=861266 RepID=A0A024GWC0_9MICC|nr:hypothetical protein [Pseudarthrobacter siccitolerans]CCQ44165.1 sodium Bile acid symporter family protein [Pseudarthrobacter siccitolerans]